MATRERQTDALVIGGGLSGLTAATYLGRAGLSVRLIEKATRLGGRASTDASQGFLLNRGPHAIYRAGEAPRVLGELGVTFSAGAPPVSGWALKGGSLHRLPLGSASLLSTRLLGWAGKANAASWMARVPQMKSAGLADVSVSDWLSESGVKPDVSPIMEGLVRLSTYANAPASFSAATALAQLQKAQRGVLYVDGGWQTLVDGLAARARFSGCQLEDSARAQALRPTPGGYSVTLADGREIAARVVVLAASRKATLGLLSSAGVPAPADPAPSIHMSALDIGLTRVPRPDQRFVLGIDRPLYLSVHSGISKLSEDGFVIHIGKYLDGESDPTADRAELEELLDLAQPGWRGAVRSARFLPRLVVANRLDTARQGGPEGRPDFRVRDLPGVFIAGDWVKGGSWLCDASLATARQAAVAAVELLSRRKAVA